MLLGHQLFPRGIVAESYFLDPGHLTERSPGATRLKSEDFSLVQYVLPFVEADGSAFNPRCDHAGNPLRARRRTKSSLRRSCAPQ